MKRYAFIRAALAETTEAAEYYDEQQKGLGRQFAEAVDEAVDQIRRAPELRPYYVGSIRSWRVRTFPYRLLYRVSGDTVRIFAVMHLKRRPNYWKNRI